MFDNLRQTSDNLRKSEIFESDGVIFGNLLKCTSKVRKSIKMSG